MSETTAAQPHESESFWAELIDEARSSSNPVAKTEVRFALDENGEPRKLGDGSFGIVFEGTGRGQPCAIKVLYDSAAIDPRPLSEMSGEELNAIAHEVAQECGLDAERLTQTVRQHKDNADRLALEVFRLVGIDATSADAPTPAEQVLKLMREKASSAAAERFRRESSVSVLLRNSEKARHRRSITDLTGTVEVWGGTVHFKDSGAFKSLGEYFAKRKVEVSDYALAMDLFDYSLKDLLEKGSRKSSANPTGARNGYALLKTLPFEYRVREALLFLYPIAVGLERLHNTQVREQPLFHLDIKPGNIFIREEENAEGFVAALGDLGYLPPQKAGPDLENSLRSRTSEQKGGLMAPGTQHYRSPEQKDHMDVAYVAVKHEPLGETSVTQLTQPTQPTQPSRSLHVVLEVQDPKFENNLIEPEDFVIFSKDKRQIPYDIVKMEPKPDAPNVLRIEINADPARVVEEPKTQVAFHKRQAFRTDLFGIGAVAFDIITAGQSPERFYESIRKFEKGDIGDIIERYQRLSKGMTEADDPDLVQIFRPFRNDDSSDSPYADDDIVKFILQCMLYRVAGTFYADFASPDKRDLRGEAITRLKEAVVTLRAKYLHGVNTSILITGNVPSNVASLQRQFDSEVDVLQGLEPWVDLTLANPEIGDDNVNGDGDERASADAGVSADAFGGDGTLREVNRLLLGSFYLLQLVTLVRDHIATQADTKKRSFLYQMLPAYIGVEQDNENVKLKFDYPTYVDEKAYWKDLRHNRLGRIVRSVGNPFVPNRVSGMRRQMRLYRVQDEPNDAGTWAFKVQLTDASLLKTTIAPGDWLVMQHPALPQQQQLWRIQTVGGVTGDEADALTLAYQPLNGDTTPTEPPPNNDALYYAQLDPFKYYLDMLGLYLNHLVFAHSVFTTATRDKLDIPGMLLLLGVRSNLPLVVPNPPKPAPAATPKTKAAPGKEDPASFAPKPSDFPELKHVYESYVHLMLKLTLHDSEDSYYADKVSQDQKLGAKADPGDLEKNVLNRVYRFAESQYERLLDLFRVQNPPPPPQRPRPVRALADGLRLRLEAMTDTRFDVVEAIKRAAGAPDR